MMGFDLTNPTKVQARTFSQTKAEQRIKKGRGKEKTYPQIGFSASETPNEEGYGHVWESDDWSASHWTDDSWTPDAGCFCTRTYTAWMVATPLNLASHPTHPTHVVLAAHGQLDQERQSKQSRSMHGVVALRRNSAVVTHLSCLPTPRQKPARKVALSTSQQFHHVLQS